MSVLARRLDSIDDEHVERTGGWLELQAQLLPQGGEQLWRIGRRRFSRTKQSTRSERQQEIPPAGEAGAVEDRPSDGARENSRELEAYFAAPLKNSSGTGAHAAGNFRVRRLRHRRRPARARRRGCILAQGVAVEFCWPDVGPEFPVRSRQQQVIDGDLLDLAVKRQLQALFQQSLHRARPGGWSG